MNLAPEVTAFRTNATFFSFIPLSSMFTAVDPDAFEDALEDNESTVIERYRIRDQGFAGGQFVLFDEDGDIEELFDEGVTFTITPDQVPNVFYANFNLSETFSESFAIEAFDGIDASPFVNNVVFATPNAGLNSAPIVRVNSSNVAINGRLALTNLFTVEDADNNVQSINLRDNRNGGGFFTLDGEVLAANRFHNIDIDDIGNVFYNGAANVSGETFSVQAFDGELRSQLLTAPVFTGNTSPVVTSRGNPRVRSGQNVAASSLFNVTDADGDTIRSYFFVDRNPSANSGFFELDGERQLAGVFFRIDADELSGLRYIGGNPGGTTDTIGIQAYDGRTFSEITNVSVRTSAAPTIVGTNAAVLSGETVLASTLFNVVDLDGDTPRTYFITDRNTSANTGFFELDGTRLQSASFRRLNAAQFSRLRYQGGARSGTENVGVQVFDGTELSAITNFTVNTISTPTLTTRDGSLFPGRSIDVSSLVTFQDADGDEAVTYRLLDRFSASNTGNFVLDGSQLPSGTFFEVNAAQFERLEYIGGVFGEVNEEILISVSDGSGFSEQESFVITTLENANAPVLRVFNVNGRVGTQLSARSLFSFTDAEGDTLSTVTFTDSSSQPNGNFFAIDGVEQTAQQPFTVDFSLVQAGRVTYTLGSLGASESFRINASDGTNTGQQVIGTATGLVLPQISVNPNLGNDVSIDTFEELNIFGADFTGLGGEALIQQTDAGGALDRFQIFDPNTEARSGGFQLDGTFLQQGVVNQLNAAQFERLVFVGAEVDNGRQLDPVLIQAGNALGFSDFIRVNVNTDQIGPDPTPSAFQFQPLFGQDANAPQEITFTFVDGGNQAGGTERAPNGNLPSYYFDNGEDNNNNAQVQANGTRALNRFQREEVRSVLENIESFANVNFVEVPFEFSASAAQITYGAYRFQGNANGPRYVELGPTALFDNDGIIKDTNLNNGLGEERGDIWFDTEEFNPANFTDVGDGSFYRLAAFQGTLSSLSVFLNANLSIFNDFQYNTLFSGLTGGINDPLPPYDGRPNTLQLYDVVAAQGQYGANPTFNNDNNQYFFTDTNLTTLYDSGGLDTINFQGRNGTNLGVFNDTIDLRQGQFSSINGVANSLRISYGTIIENARGGSGDDTLIGNETKNLIFGNDGNDSINGGGGNDVLMGGDGDDLYTWTLGDGRDTITERAVTDGGTDTIRITDASNQLNSLADDLTFRRLGNDLRIDLTLDQGRGQGTINIRNFADASERVELLQLVDINGDQIGNDISLNSIFQNADSTAQRFQVTSNVPNDPTDPSQGQLSLASPV